MMNRVKSMVRKAWKLLPQGFRERIYIGGGV